MRRFLPLLALLLGLLTACGGKAPEPAPTESVPASVSVPVPTTEQPSAEPEPLPDLWADYDTVTVQPFIPQELEEAYGTAKPAIEQAVGAAGELTWLRLCYDPILTQHDCVEEYDASNPAGWRIKDYFANRISLTYDVALTDAGGARTERWGSVKLHRQNDRELWQLGEMTDLRAEQSALVRDGEELRVLFDNAVTGYVLPDGAVTAYCRDERGAISVQTGRMPWGGTRKAMSAEPYFAEIRPYTDADLFYEPDWLGGDLAIETGEDGLLGLYRQGELLWAYFDAGLSHAFTEGWIYYIDGDALSRVDYGGRARQVLYRNGALLQTFYVADDTVFFVAAAGENPGVYRLYAPEGRCELLSMEVPDEMSGIGLEPPVSNVEAVWSYANPAFLELAEAQRDSYEAVYGGLDNITYYGLLEQDYGEYSRILCYYNSLTQEYYETKSGWVYLKPDRTPENVEQNGSAWWKDFQTQN